MDIFTQVFNFLSILGILLDVVQHPNGHRARKANDIATLKINLLEYPVSSVNQFASQF